MITNRLESSLGPLRLRSPLIVGSGPSTTQIDDLLAAERAGAGAVITKSIGSHPETPLDADDRRRYRAIRGYGTYLKSTYLKEILSFERGMALLSSTRRLGRIPVIASLFHPQVEGDQAFEAWRRLARGAEAAGAAAVQIDFFYVNLRKLNDARIDAITTFISKLAEEVSIPVFPKLNVGMDDDLVRAIARLPGLPGLVFIDSINVQPWIDIHDRGRPIYDGVLFNETTGRSHGVLAGEPLLHFTLGMVQRLRALTPTALCAGGGLSRWSDVVRCLMLGATSVHLTSTVMLRGWRALTTMNELITRFLDDEGFASVGELVGLSLDADAADREGRSVRVKPKVFTDVRARLIEDQCIHCDKCESLTVCNSFRSVPYNFIDHCDGCSFCVPVCPTQALVLEPV